jgi:GNAT superfamily N-acetyltransferase
MGADATIRRLRSDDAASFKAIRLEALKASPELLQSTFELEDKLDVAWFAGRLEDAHVLGRFETASLRNLGLGRLLLDAVLDVACESVELIQLSVVSENRPALRLYERVGFLEFGRETKASKYGDKYYNETLMVLDFGRTVDVC